MSACAQQQGNKAEVLWLIATGRRMLLQNIATVAVIIMRKRANKALNMFP
jgi:hypothetical protein